MHLETISLLTLLGNQIRQFIYKEVKIENRDFFYNKSLFSRFSSSDNQN